MHGHTCMEVANLGHQRQSGGYNFLSSALFDLHLMVKVIKGHLLSSVGKSGTASLGDAPSNVIKSAMDEKFPPSEGTCASNADLGPIILTD